MWEEKAMSLTLIQDTARSLGLEAQRASSPAVTRTRTGRTSHPDPNGPPDRRPIEVGEVWENPVTGEYAKLLELPWQNQQGRGVGELIALAGARVMGEHYHPALTERFTPLEGELTVKRNGQVSVLRQGETAVVEPGVWHDWWNATGRDIRVRVEVTPGERFVHMIETFYGLARLGHTDSKGMPHPLQLALCAREFSDVIVFRTPPRLLQLAIFGALGLIARSRGYSATYPQLSRTVLAPRI
jgi:quercetin dioxygenase-like cupin family protein